MPTLASCTRHRVGFSTLRFLHSTQDRAIGRIVSCYSRRNGTPRQPALVTRARAVLHLKRQLPLESLEGLDQYSHCWVIYVFHQNTNLHLDDGKVR